MKRYFNKGLFFQWFNSAKMVILLGIIVWGIWCNSLVEKHIDRSSTIISHNFFNSYSTYTIFCYGILGIIFAVIHFMSQGINKRNTGLFLTSAPYTKKQIKYNEFICLMMTLAVFIVVMIYINIMAYIRHYELISIIDGYFTALFIEIIKMILFGTIGILILLIVDSMFSNTIVGIICMLTVLPASLLFIFIRLFTILDYLPAGNDISILRKISDFIGINIFRGNTIYLLESCSISKISKGDIIIEIIFSIAIAVILLGIYYLMQKKYKVESNTKMFTSKLNERIVVIFTSIGAGTIASQFFMSLYGQELADINYTPLNGIVLAKVLSMDVIIVIVVAVICNKLLNKILRSIQ